ncbi:Major facilitator superfamily protein [Zea mays]|uniref:Major facilitator superfamily protein n=1 Tax=Zea mays TaxID=4577 RepID=A0A1D6LTQ9_MAIZE|nr:Major facilitator superfamily protein [Zea mays]
MVVSGAVAPLPYWQMRVFLCLGGNNTTWMNTAVLVTCIRNFRRSRGPVSGLLKGYVGLSTVIFTDTYSALLSLYCRLPPPPSARRNPFVAAPRKPYLHPHMPRPPQTIAPPSARPPAAKPAAIRSRAAPSNPEQSVVASKWLWSSGDDDEGDLENGQVSKRRRTATNLSMRKSSNRNYA